MYLFLDILTLFGQSFYLQRIKYNCSHSFLLELCVMKGVQYTKGQKWDDGCDKTCVCDDDTTGHYTCLDR